MNHSSDKRAAPSEATAAIRNPAQSQPYETEISWQQRLVNLLPPATVIAVVAGWMLAPQAITENPMSLLVAGICTSFFLLAMEQLFERHEGWRLNRQEFVTDLFYFILMYTAIGWAVETFADGPLLTLKEKLGLATPWVGQMPFIAQVALIIFLIELGQYWMHRLMHNWYPLWLTHAPHHHVTQLNAMKGFVGNPLELFLISLSVVALLDFAIAPLFCALTVLGVVSGYAHANIRSDPPPVYSFAFTTIRNHSLHHTALSYEDTRCNYANSLILLDRIFGTYREGESSVVGQDERRRLSIYEQFMFPFQPVIDRLSGKPSGGR
ncbi:MAG: sterol desaturase family protein [Alteraurantiacibacter sp.]